MSDHFSGEQIETDIISITLLGASGIGKTSLVRRFHHGFFMKNLPLTLGAEYSFGKVSIDTGPTNIRICDIACQNFFSTLKQNFMRNTHGAMLVFDLTEPKSFNNLHSWLYDYLAANNFDKQLPILLVGNKLDLAVDRRIRITDIRRFLNLMEIESELQPNIVGFVETSAKTGIGINEGFSLISRKIMGVKWKQPNFQNSDSHYPDCEQR